MVLDIFGCGMTIVGPYLSSALIPLTGQKTVLYVGMIFVLIGTFFASFES